MTRSIFMVLVLGVVIGMAPVAVFANPGTLADLGFGGPGMDGYDSSPAQRAAESPGMVDADIWPVSGPVETGAVPGESRDKGMSPDDMRPGPPNHGFPWVAEDGGGGG